ncbi:MAG: IS200/IS605 family transposase [Pseudoflavonifractor sp.]|nr:IS200/IS605 family transposase [Pseudoflavonifractor sp.]
MSKTCNLIHIVFSTKSRIPALSLDPAVREALFRYIWSVIRNNKCSLSKIGGYTDHIHILLDLHPTMTLASVMADIKRSSSIWLREHNLDYPAFIGWGEGYYAASVSPGNREVVGQYIANQISHHSGRLFLDELRQLADENCLSFHPADF